MEINVTLFLLLSDSEIMNNMNTDLLMMFSQTEPCPDDTYWEVGECCVAKYDLSQGWYRAKVLKVSS